VTFPTVVAAVLLVLSDCQEPSPALKTTANAVNQGKVLNEEGNGRNFRISAAGREKQVSAGKRGSVANNSHLAIVSEKNGIQFGHNFVDFTGSGLVIRCGLP
jgi:hypothetical protein